VISVLVVRLIRLVFGIGLLVMAYELVHFVVSMPEASASQAGMQNSVQVMTYLVAAFVAISGIVIMFGSGTKPVGK